MPYRPWRGAVVPRLTVVLTLALLVATSSFGPHTEAQAEPTVAVGGAGVPATVLGIEGINVRACPSTDCEVVATVKLGDSVTVTGGPVDGFSPVDYGGLQGYAYDLYLVKQGAPAPFLVEGQPGCKRLALIFNVGIGEPPVLSILDDLAARDVAATVFVMGWWAAAHPAELRRIADQGFVIGSHGDQRQELTSLGDQGVAHDIANAHAAIGAVLGEAPSPWFTAYGGASDGRVRGIVAQMGYLPVGWKVPAADYGPGATPKSVYSRVMPGVYDGAIVEFHLDGSASAASTGVALPWIVDELRARGYRFVTVPEMAEPCGR